MTEPKFTPGPWVMVFDNRNDALCIWNKEKDFLIASIALLGVKGEIEKRRFADFKLIADAWQLPDLRREIKELKEIKTELIEALEAHCETCKTEWDFHQSWCDCCGYHKSIRKAKGEKNDRA